MNERERERGDDWLIRLSAQEDYVQYVLDYFYR